MGQPTLSMGSRWVSAFGATAFAVMAPVQAQDAAPQAEAEEIVVQATRSGRSVDNEAIRVEVVEREEIEEKILMTPGNVAMLVAETPGVRVQVTSPSLGSSNIRMQGMEGRYTQLLSDGLPLYGGQTSSVGLLQIPPTDLGQVEIIKGAASALYGPSALGGVINFVSRRPGNVPEAELLLNATSRNGQDIAAYAAMPVGAAAGLSVTGGFHRQSANDLDGDGWADMPRYERWTLRPRLFLDGAGGGKLMLTIGATTEDRVGGTLRGRTAPDGLSFVEALETRRLDAGLIGEIPVTGSATLQIRASGTTQEHSHRFGGLLENDRHNTVFGETSLAGKVGDTAWIAGVALQYDGYRSKTFPAFDYDFTVPAVFGQVESEITERLTLVGSARFDQHSEYGSHLNPRISALYKPGPWTIRASYGRGFYAPTPFVEQIEAVGLSRLEPITGLGAETAETASVDVGYRAGEFSANLSLFASNIEGAVQVQDAGPQRVRLINAAGTARTRGAEAMLRYRLDAFSLTGSYVYVDANEPDPQNGGHRTVPRTPRHTAGVVGMWEESGRGRIGIEAYYTGRQQLDANPYRSVSKPYVEIGALIEVVLGSARLFLNAENVLDVRQTSYDPLLLPARAPDGRWTVDVWAPADGFVLNGGIRLMFGGS